MFRDSTFAALEELGKVFIYNMINAMGTYAEVEANITKEMDCAPLFLCFLATMRW